MQSFIEIHIHVNSPQHSARMLNTQPQMRVLLGVLWWSGCSPEQIPPGPKSVSTTGPEYAQFKQDVDRSFSILDWNDMRIDWRHFDAAAMYVRTATGRGEIQEKFFETIGLAQIESAANRGRAQRNEKGRWLLPQIVPRLLAASRLIDFSQHRAEDRPLLLNQAVRLLSKALARRPSLTELRDLCQTHARITGKDVQGCPGRALQHREAYLIALVSVGDALPKRVKADMQSFSVTIWTAALQVPPDETSTVALVIDRFWEFLDMFHQLPEISIEARDAAAVTLVRSTMTAAHALQTRPLLRELP